MDLNSKNDLKACYDHKAKLYFYETVNSQAYAVADIAAVSDLVHDQLCWYINYAWWPSIK